MPQRSTLIEHNRKRRKGSLLIVNADHAPSELALWVGRLARWSVRADLTFKNPRGAESALKAFELFMRQVIPAVSYFVAVEPNPGRPGYHLHALWADCEDVQRKKVWKRWFSEHGRALIEPVRCVESALVYAGKAVNYAAKSPALWHVHLCNSQLWHAARAGGCFPQNDRQRVERSSQCPGGISGGRRPSLGVAPHESTIPLT